MCIRDRNKTVPIGRTDEWDLQLRDVQLRLYCTTYPERGEARNTTLGLRVEGGVVAWERSIFIIAFLLHFGGFNGVCASERNATHLHFFLALHFGNNEAGVGLSLFATVLSRVKVATTAALPSRTFLSVFSSTVYFVQFVEFCFI